MLSYEEFRDVVLKNLITYFPEEVRNNYEISTQVVLKPNAKREGILIKNKLVKDMNATPMAPEFYLESMYRENMSYDDIDKVMHDIVSYVLENQQIKISKEWLLTEKAKENVVYEIVNTAWNAEMLASRPHREILDLSYVYAIALDVTISDIYCEIPVTCELADLWGFDEEKLFELASKNTQRLRPVVVKTMSEILNELMKECDLDSTVPMTEMPVPTYIITNSKKHRGAVWFLDKDVLTKLANEMQSSLYILPSSLHEAIVIEANENVGVECLIDMVLQVNKEQLELEDRLSNQVYFFDKETRELCIATSTLYKMFNNPN